MHDYTPDVCPAQPVRASFKRILLHCVDTAQDADAVAMLSIMYHNGLLTAPETFAEIVGRGLTA